MQKFSRSKRSLALALLAACALVVAACTRSASPDVVPADATQPAADNPTPQQGGPQPGTDPTMDALGTQVRETQTAQAGGGQPVEVPTQQPGVENPTAVPPTLPPADVQPTVAAPTPVPPAAVGCANPYEVKQGEWIYKIARDCKLDPKAIVAANPGVNPDRLVPGQKINLPGGVGGAPAPVATLQPGCTGQHTVARGENLFRLAYGCGLTTEELARFNNIMYPFVIYPGDVIKFP